MALYLALAGQLWPRLCTCPPSLCGSGGAALFVQTQARRAGGEQYNSDEYILKKRLKGKETLLAVPYPNMWCRTHIYVLCNLNGFHEYNAFGFTAF